jgi:Fe-S-cluster containining protein
VTRQEWEPIRDALPALPAGTAAAVRHRIRESAQASRPVICPLLDPQSGACLVYAARPVPCRSYGFYAEREFVLGCGRIEAIASATSTIIWGNHTALEERMEALGDAAELSEWLAGDT